jgi:hypothetical protein
MTGASAPQKIVFVHIPKSAGTSLRTWLSGYFTPEKLCPEFHDRLPTWDRTSLNRYELFCGHYQYETLSLIDGPMILLTMLREPKARLLSWYYYGKSYTLEHIETAAQNILPQKKMGLEQYLCEHGRDAGNIATRMIGGGDLSLAKSRLQEFSAVGIMEKMNASLQVFAQAIGREVDQPIPRENVTGARCDEPEFEATPPIREPITPEIERLLHDCTANDRELYHFATTSRAI